MNILTFDIEEWFHLLDNESTSTDIQWRKFEPRIHANIERLIEATLLHGHKATFFCLGWIAEKYPEVIRTITQHGFEVATHSHMHQLVYHQTPSRFREDLRRSVHTLEDITGKKVISYRAPGFSFVRDTSWVIEILLELGIERDSSIFPASHAHGGYPGFGRAVPSILTSDGGCIKEFPISTGKLLGKAIMFSGGGYFRLIPYPLIHHLAKNSDYMMTYFHPRDFDAAQPRLKLPLHRKFRSYIGLSGAFDKFTRLISQNQFVDINTADKLVDWDRAPTVTIQGQQPGSVVSTNSATALPNESPSLHLAASSDKRP